MPVPSSTKPTTILLRKQSTSTVKLRNRRRAIKRLVITAPKTRSYRPYFLPSSSRSSNKHTMDDIEVICDRELWSGGLEEVLVDILYQETLEGKLVRSRVTSRDIDRLVTRLNQLGIRPVNALQVKGKIARLKKMQRKFTDLMGQTGMGWNPITKTVVVTEEHWANVIRVRSQWKKYKTNGCANYDILCTIFGQAVATGVLHYASTQEPPSREEEQHQEEELRARGPVLGSGVGLDTTVDLDDITMTPSTQGGVSQRRAPRRRRRDAAGPSFSPVLSDAIQKLAATSEQRLELDAKMFELCSTKRSRGEGSNSGSDAGFNSVAQCMKFLQDITPPLPPDVHLRAVKAFMDPHVLNVFQNMTPAMRIDWVWSLS